MKIRTRFAPSPTGYLHVGGLRTALYAYLLAKQNKGDFLLRIEDTDRERFVADGTLNILKSLYWAGLVPDEGVCLKGEEIVQKGKFGPYIQSERLEIYAKYATQLLAQKDAYYCFCKPERLEALREQQQRLKQPTGYDGHCLHLSAEEVKAKLDAGEKHVVRMKMPQDGETVFNDLIRGEIKFQNALVDDQIIVKSDGYPTYHLAVVVDDHSMNITHVIRGEEWISSTPKHLQLYKYFGWEAPQFAHLPLNLNADKSKLSKRQGDVAVEDYRRKGYLPEALLNFVAFLGWNPGDEREIFSLSELVKEFSLAKVSKSGSVFNLEKLDWFNKEYIKKLSDEELIERAKPFLSEMINDKGYSTKQLAKIIALEKERVTTLSELPVALAFAFKLPDYPVELLVWKKSTAEEVKKILPEVLEELNKIKKWTKADLEQKTGEWIKEKNYSNGQVLWPLRVALSGQEKSPGPYEIMEALDKEESLKRIEIAINKF